MKCIGKSWKCTVIRQISTTYRLLLLKKEEVTQPKRSKRSLVLLVPVAFKSRGKVTKAKEKVTKSRGKVTKSKEKVTKSRKKVTKSKTLTLNLDTQTLQKCHCLTSKGIWSISVLFLEPPKRYLTELESACIPRIESVTSPPLLQQDICRWPILKIQRQAIKNTRK